MTSSPRERRLAYFAWVAVCVIWGTTYLGIRVSCSYAARAMAGCDGLSPGAAGWVLLAAASVSTRPVGGYRPESFLILGLARGGRRRRIWCRAGRGGASCDVTSDAAVERSADGERLPAPR